jgi:hypothetical protein
MKTTMFIAAIAAVTALGAEPASDTMRQKLRAKITESLPAFQAPKAAEEAATTVESAVFARPMPSEASAIDHRKAYEEDVIMMKPMTVAERFSLRRLELAMELEGAKKQAEKNRHFSIWRGGGIIYEGRLGKAHFAFGVVGPLPFFGLSW